MRRNASRATCIALLLGFLLGTLHQAGACETGFVSASPSLIDLYFTAYSQILERHVTAEPDGTVYVSTGDIAAEWLRDSSAVARAYIGLAQSDHGAAQALRGIIARQAKYLLLAPYANAFTADYRVVEEKFEVDSLLYPIWLAYLYWRQTGDTSFFGGEESLAFDRVLAVLRDEQHHAERSHYRHPALPNNGRGAAVSFTGMVWCGFRPSDDACRYGYNIPVNSFAVVVMRELTDIERTIYRNPAQAANAWGLSVQIQRGVEQFGTVDVEGFGRVYAYEVDGRGGTNLMDDANIPSLLSMPYFGYVPVTDPLYQNTRRLVLSERNPYFYSGAYAQGVGSPHTPRGYIWPLALVMQALTSTDDAETARVLGYIAASDVGDRRLHESFDADRPESYTRADFAWPNALYTELIAALHPKAETASSPAGDECFNGIVNPQ